MRYIGVFLGILLALMALSALLPKYFAAWVIATGKINWLATFVLNSIYSLIVTLTIRYEQRN